MSNAPPSAPGVTVFTVEGDFDLSNRNSLRERLLASLPPGRPLVLVDLSKCGTVDSEGLGAFLSIAREIHERGGALKFCSPPPLLDRLFRATRLYLAFEVHADRASALDSF